LKRLSRSCRVPASRPASGRLGGSSREKLVLKSSPLVKLGPEWQVVHLPFPMKIWSPRWAGVE